MKSHTLVAPFVISACLISVDAYAACMVCWLGTCYTFPENSCNEYTGTSPCFTLGAEMFKPNTDHVLAEKGQAWLVQGQKKTPFASDSMGASFTRLQARYPASTKGDPKSSKEREAAWAALVAKPDGGVISPGVLAKFSKEMGLGLRQAETGPRK